MRTWPLFHVLLVGQGAQTQGGSETRHLYFFLPHSLSEGATSFHHSEEGRGKKERVWRLSLRFLGWVAFPTIPSGLSHELGENEEGERQVTYGEGLLTMSAGSRETGAQFLLDGGVWCNSRWSGRLLLWNPRKLYCHSWCVHSACSCLGWWVRHPHPVLSGLLLLSS